MGYYSCGNVNLGFKKIEKSFGCWMNVNNEEIFKGNKISLIIMSPNVDLKFVWCIFE